MDTRSDIYSLGVLLYELLTGATPFDRQRFATAAYDEIRRIIKEEEPPKPSTRLSTMGETLSKVSSQRKTEPAKLSALVKGDLDWIVMKALEKDRTRRYETASGFAADVRRFLAEQPIEARPPSAWYRFQKMARRNRVALTTSALVFVTLLAGLAASTWQAVRATSAEAAALKDRDDKEEARQAEARQRSIAEEAQKTMERERDAANAARAELRRSHYLATMNLVPMAWQTDNVKRVLELLDDASPKPGDKEDLRHFEWHYWDRLCHAERRSLPPIEAVGTKVEFSGDGKRFVFYKGKIEAVPDKSAPGLGPPLQRATAMVIQVADTARGRPVGTECRCAVGSSFALNRDGSRLAYVAPHPADGPWDPKKPKQGNLFVRELATGKDIVLCQGFVTSGLDESRLTFSPDGQRLAAFGTVGPGPAAQRQVCVWDLTEPGREPVLLAYVKAFRNVSLDFNFEGSRVAGVFFNQGGFQRESESSIVVWDTVTGKIRAQLTTKGKVRHVAFTPDGKQLVGLGTAWVPFTAGEPCTYLWDGAAGDELKLLRATPAPRLTFGIDYRYLTLSPDGRRLAISPIDMHCVRIIDTKTGEERQSIKSVDSMSTAAFNADASRLWVAEAASVSLRGSKLTLKEWDLEPDRPRAVDPSVVRSAREVVVWSKDGARQAVFQQEPLVLRSPALKDEKPKAAPVISIRDKSGREIHQFREHSLPIGSVVFSPNGRFVYSYTSRRGEAMVWETETGKIRWRRDSTFNFAVLMMRYSPDLRFLALADDQKRPNQKIVGFDDLQKMKFDDFQKMFGHKIVRFDDLHEMFRVAGRTLGLVFSPDGRRLVTQSDRMRLWDVEAGREIIAAPGLGRGTIVFSSDSRWFATGGGRTGVTVYDAATGEKRAEMQEGMGRLFTPRNMVFSPDGARLAILGTASPYVESLTTTVHDLATGKLICRLEGNTFPVTHLAFSPNGKRIATTTALPPNKAGEVKLWDASTGRELLSLPALGGVGLRLWFSPDGQRLTLRHEGLETTWDATPRKKPIERR